MYLAKQRGRNRAELFDEQLRQVAAERISLIADLRHAVAREELRVHYQPVFTLDGEQLLGMEALVRWQHPQRGLLFPDAFIPAAETASLIGEIGAWVLHDGLPPGRAVGERRARTAVRCTWLSTSPLASSRRAAGWSSWWPRSWQLRRSIRRPSSSR